MATSRLLLIHQADSKPTISVTSSSLPVPAATPSGSSASEGPTSRQSTSGEDSNSSNESYSGQSVVDLGNRLENDFIGIGMSVTRVRLADVQHGEKSTQKTKGSIQPVTSNHVTYPVANVNKDNNTTTRVTTTAAGLPQERRRQRRPSLRRSNAILMPLEEGEEVQSSSSVPSDPLVDTSSCEGPHTPSYKDLITPSPRVQNTSMFNFQDIPMTESASAGKLSPPKLEENARLDRELGNTIVSQTSQVFASVDEPVKEDGVVGGSVRHVPVENTSALLDSAQVAVIIGTENGPMN